MLPQEQHIPVLKREVLDAMQIRADGVYLDATLGRCGHAEAIVSKLGEQGRLIGMDRDPRAIEVAKSIFENDERVTLAHSDFDRIETVMAQHQITQGLDAVLMDLGVSSPQLDQAERGFSFMRDGELDMRMNTSQGESASQWLARVEEADLVEVLFKYGEEKFARRIARGIIAERELRPLVSTVQLAQVVRESMPRIDKNKHPATRTFQAIRIFINQELDQIESALPQAVKHLKQGGRLAVISFHSLEDRLVKRFIRSQSKPQLPPKNIPVIESDYVMPLKAIGRAIKPSKEEITANPRSRSSVLRVAEKVIAGGAYAG